MSRRKYFTQIGFLMLATFLSKELVNYFTMGDYAVPYGTPYPIYASLLQAVFLSILIFSLVRANIIGMKRRENSHVDTDQTYLDVNFGFFVGPMSIASFLSSAATVFIAVEFADLTKNIRTDNFVRVFVLCLFFIPMLAKEAVKHSDPREVTP